MYIQALTRNEANLAVLTLSWVYSTFLRGILVQIANNAEFTGESLRTFLIPVVPGCTFDIGAGAWFIRVGGLVGDIVQGHVEWSGVYGPWLVESPKLSFAAVAPKFSILAVSSSPEALRLHTDPSEATLAFWEVTKASPDFPGSTTKWFYGVGAGEFFVKGLDADKRTWVRLHLLLTPIPMFNKSLNLVNETGLVGTEFTIYTLCSGRVGSGTPMKPARLVTGSDRSDRVGDAALLQQATITPNMKFASHGDYLRFKAATERRKA